MAGPKMVSTAVWSRTLSAGSDGGRASGHPVPWMGTGKTLRDGQPPEGASRNLPKVTGLPVEQALHNGLICSEPIVGGGGWVESS